MKDYKEIDGWFNMEEEYSRIIDSVPDGGIFVELGVWKGKSTAFACQYILEKQRQIHLYAVDTFAGPDDNATPLELEAYKPYKDVDIYGLFKSNLEGHNVNVIRCRSDYAASFFKDNQVDAIFVDAGHSYESVKRDLQAWNWKVKEGGIWAGHDYGAWAGVKKAVDEFFPQKVEHTVNDCWFFVHKA